MKLRILVGSLLLALLATPVVAADLSEAEATCRGYAAEDKVPAEELDDYLRNCIADLTGVEPEKIEFGEEGRAVVSE